MLDGVIFQRELNLRTTFENRLFFLSLRSSDHRRFENFWNHSSFQIYSRCSSFWLLFESMMIIMSMMKSGDCLWKSLVRDSWLRLCRIDSSNAIRSYHAELNECIEFDWNNGRANDVHITIAITRYEYCIMLKLKSTFYSIDNWWLSLRKKFNVREHCYCSFTSWLHDDICYTEIIASERKFFAR